MKNFWMSTSEINEWFALGKILAGKLKDQSIYDLMKEADKVDSSENNKINISTQAFNQELT